MRNRSMLGRALRAFAAQGAPMSSKWYEKMEEAVSAQAITRQARKPSTRSSHESLGAQRTNHGSGAAGLPSSLRKTELAPAPSGSAASVGAREAYHRRTCAGRPRSRRLPPVACARPRRVEEEEGGEEGEGREREAGGGSTIS